MFVAVKWTLTSEIMNVISSLHSREIIISRLERSINMSLKVNVVETISVKPSKCKKHAAFKFEQILMVISCSVPHITNALQNWIERVAKIPVDKSGAEPDVCVIELGRML